MTNDTKTSSKSSTLKYALSTLFLFLLILIGYRWCNPNKKTGPTLGDPVKAPVAIAFLDANRLLDTRIKNVKITINDPGGMVVSSNGLPISSVTLSGGVISLALKKTAVYSSDQPYQFSIKAEAEGYSSNQRNILVTRDEGQYIAVFMLGLKTPTPGTAVFTGLKPLTNSALMAGASLLPDTANGVITTNLRVDIPAGAQPIYCNRNNGSAPPAKNLNYRITYASPRSPQVSRSFPGGTLVTDAKSANGDALATPASPMFFASAGWINIEMDADGDPVNGFSKPVTVTMPIPDSLINPNTKQFYKINDKIDVWSLNAQGTWLQEDVTKVEGSPGNLSAKMTVTHLSTWNLDFPHGKCSSDLVVHYNAGAGTADRWSEMWLAQEGTLLPITSAGDDDDYVLSYANAGGDISISRGPDDEEVAFIVYNSTTGPDNKLVTSPIFSCSSPNVTITIPGTPQQVIVDIQLDDGTQLCNTAVWYLSCNSCSEDDAQGPGNCAENTDLAFLYGGILCDGGADCGGDAGRVTLSGTTAFTGTFCLRLWYADSVAGVTTEKAIDFPVNFSYILDTPADEFNGYSTDGDVIGMSHYYSGGVHYILIEAADAPTALTDCLP